MMNLEYAPRHTHIAFSPVIKKTSQKAQIFGDAHQNVQEVEVDQQFSVFESFFGVMGEYGNNVMVYDTVSICLKHQITPGSTLRSFEFSKNGQEMIAATVEQKIKFFALTKFEGQLIREIHSVHR